MAKKKTEKKAAKAITRAVKKALYKGVTEDVVDRAVKKAVVTDAKKKAPKGPKPAKTPKAAGIPVGPAKAKRLPIE